MTHNLSRMKTLALAIPFFRLTANIDRWHTISFSATPMRSAKQNAKENKSLKVVVANL